MKHRSKLSWIVIMVLVFSTLFGGIAAAETYTVKKGDTLWTIAKTNGTTVAEMQKLNRLKNVNILQVGQKLKLPEKPSTGSEVPQKEEEAESTTITILGTSDVHGNLWGYTYEDSAETTNNGLARISTYVNDVKKTSLTCC